MHINPQREFPGMYEKETDIQGFLELSLIKMPQEIVKYLGSRVIDLIKPNQDLNKQ